MYADAVLVVDGGDFVATAAYTVRPRGPLSWLDPGVFGTSALGSAVVEETTLKTRPLSAPADPAALARRTSRAARTPQVRFIRPSGR